MDFRNNYNFDEKTNINIYLYEYIIMNYTIEDLMYINDGICPFNNTFIGYGGLGYTPRMTGGMAKRDIKTGKIMTENIKALPIAFEESKGGEEIPELTEIEQVELKDLNLDDIISFTEEENVLLSELDDIIEIYNNEKQGLTTDELIELNKEFNVNIDAINIKTADVLKEYVRNIKSFVNENKDIDKQQAIEKTIENMTNNMIDDPYIPTELKTPEIKAILEEFTEMNNQYDNLFTDEYRKFSNPDNYKVEQTAKDLYIKMKEMKEQAKVELSKAPIPEDDKWEEIFITTYTRMPINQLNELFDFYKQLMTPEILISERENSKQMFKNLGSTAKARANAIERGFKGSIVEMGKKHVVGQSQRMINRIDNNLKKHFKEFGILSRPDSIATEEEKENARDALSDLYMRIRGDKEKNKVDDNDANNHLIKKIEATSANLKNKVPDILLKNIKRKLPINDATESEFFNSQYASAPNQTIRGRMTENELINNDSLLTSIDGDNSKAKFTADETGLNKKFMNFINNEKEGIIVTDKFGDTDEYKRKFLDFFPIDVVKNNTVWEIKSFENPKDYSTAKFFKAQPIYKYKINDGGIEKEATDYHTYDYEYLVKDNAGNNIIKLLPQISPTDTIMGLKNIVATIKTKVNDGRKNKYENFKLLPEKEAGEYYNYYIIESGKKNIRYMNVIDELPNIRSKVVGTTDYDILNDAFDIPLSQEKFRKLPRTYERQLMESKAGNKRSFMDVRKSIKK
jgi:hypothetical protein